MFGVMARVVTMDSGDDSEDYAKEKWVKIIETRDRLQEERKWLKSSQFQESGRRLRVTKATANFMQSIHARYSRRESLDPVPETSRSCGGQIELSVEEPQHMLLMNRQRSWQTADEDNVSERYDRRVRYDFAKSRAWSSDGETAPRELEIQSDEVCFASDRREKSRHSKVLPGKKTNLLADYSQSKHASATDGISNHSKNGVTIATNRVLTPGRIAIPCFPRGEEIQTDRRLRNGHVDSHQELLAVRNMSDADPGELSEADVIKVSGAELPTNSDRESETEKEGVLCAAAGTEKNRVLSQDVKDQLGEKEEIFATDEPTAEGQDVGDEGTLISSSSLSEEDFEQISKDLSEERRIDTADDIEIITPRKDDVIVSSTSSASDFVIVDGAEVLVETGQSAKEDFEMVDEVSTLDGERPRRGSAVMALEFPPPPPPEVPDTEYIMASGKAEESETNTEIREILREDEKTERGRTRERRKPRDVKNKKSYSDQEVRDAVETLRESSRSRSRPQSRAQSCHSDRSSPGRPARYYDWNTTHFYPDVIDVDDGCRSGRRSSFGSAYSSYVDEEWVQDLYHYDQVDMQAVLDQRPKEDAQGMAVNVDTGKLDYSLKYERVQSGAESDRSSSSSSADENPKVWKKSPLHVKRRKREERTASQEIRYDPTSEEESPQQPLDSRVRKSPRVTRKNSDIKEKMAKFDELQKKRRALDSTSEEEKVMAHLKLRSQLRQKFIQEKHAAIFPEEEAPPRPPAPPAEEVVHFNGRESYIMGDSELPQRPDQLDFQSHEEKETVKRIDEQFFERDFDERQCVEDYKNISSSFENLYDGADLSLPPCDMHRVELYREQEGVDTPDEAPVKSVSELREQFDQQTSPKWYVPKTKESYENQEAEKEFKKLDAKSLIEEEKKRFEVYKREYVRRVSERESGDEKMLSESEPSRKAIPPDDYEYVLHKIHHPKPDSGFVDSLGNHQRDKTGSTSTSDSAFSPTFTDRPASARSDSSATDKPSRSDIFEERIKELRREREETMRQLSEYTEETFFSDQSPRSQDSTQAALVESVPDIVPKEEPPLDRPTYEDDPYYYPQSQSSYPISGRYDHYDSPPTREDHQPHGDHRPQSAPVSWHSMPEIPKDSRHTQRLPRDQMDFYSYRPGEQPSSFREGQHMSHHPGFYRDDRGHERRMPAKREHPYNRDRFRSDPKMYAPQPGPNRRVMDELGLLPGPRYYGPGWQQRAAPRQQPHEPYYQSRPTEPEYNSSRPPLEPLNSTREQYRMSYQENPIDVVDCLSTPRTSHIELENLDQQVDKRRAQYEKDPMDAYKELTRPASKMTYLTEELMENYDYMRMKAGSSMSSLASEPRRPLDDVDARLQINARPQEIARSQSARHPGERPLRSAELDCQPLPDKPVEFDGSNYERRRFDTDRPNRDRTQVEFDQPISERRPVESVRPDYERPLNSMPNHQQHYYRKSPNMERRPLDHQAPSRDHEDRRPEQRTQRHNRKPHEPEWIPHRRSLPVSRASHEWPIQSLPHNLPHKSSLQSLPRGATQSQRKPNTSHYDTLPNRQPERVPAVYDSRPTQPQPRTEEPIHCPPDQEDWEKILPSFPLSPQEKMEPYNPESKRRMDPEVYRKPPPEKPSRSQQLHSQPPHPQSYKPPAQDARQYNPDPRPVYPKQAPRKPPHSDPFFEQFKPSQRPEEKARISATDVLFSGRSVAPDVPRVVKNAPRPIQEAPKQVQEAPRPIQEVLRQVQEAPRPLQEAPRQVQEAPRPLQEASRSIQDVPSRREKKEFDDEQDVVFRDYDEKVRHKMNEHRRSMAADQYEDHIKKSQEKYRALTSATLETGRSRARSSPSEYIDAELVRQRKYGRPSPPESRTSLPEETKTARAPYKPHKHKVPNFPQTKQLVKQLSKSQENVVFKQEEEEIPKVNIAEIRGKLFGENGEKLPRKMLVSNELVEVWDRDDRRRINSIKSTKFSSRDDSLPRYVSQSSVKMYSEDEPDQRLLDYVSYKDGQMKRRSNINDVLTDLEKTYERLDQEEEEERVIHERRSTQSLSGLKRLSIENVRRLEELQRHFDQLEYAKQWLATDRRPTDVDDDVFGDGASSVASGALSMTSDRHSTLPRKKADDMAYRRVNRASSGSKVDWPNQRSHSPTPSSDTRQSSASALLREEIRDDLFANKRQQRGRSPDKDAQLLANPSPTTADYLKDRTTAPARARLRMDGDKNADKYHDDLAYRSLRKDVAPVVCEIPRSYYHWRVEDSISRRSTSLERTLSERVYKNKVEREEESLQRSQSFSSTKVATVANNPSKTIAKVVQMLNVPVSCSQSAPDLADDTCFSGHYDENGEYISDDPKFARVGSKQIRKQQTPRTVKHRHDAKTRSRGFKSSGADSGYLESESDSYSSAGGGEHFSPEDDRPDITRLTDSSSSETLRKGLPREQDDYVSQVQQRAGHPMQAERRYKSDHMLYKGSGPLKKVPVRETSKQRAARLQKMKEEWLKQADNKVSEKSVSKAELKITSPVHQKAELHAELLSRKTPLRSVTSSKKVELSPPHSSIFQPAPQQAQPTTHKTIYDTKLKAPPSIIKEEDIEHELHRAKEREMKSVESIVKKNHEEACKEKKEFTVESIPFETRTTIKEIKTQVRDQPDRSKPEDRTPWASALSGRNEPRSRTKVETNFGDGFTEQQTETVTEEPSKLSFCKELKVTQDKDNQKMTKTQTQRMQKEHVVAKDTVTKRQQYQAEMKTEKLTVSERSYPMSAQESNNIFSNAVQGEILTTRVFSPPNFRSSVLSPDISDGEMTDATDITLDALVRCNQRPFSPDTVDLSDYDEVSRVMETEPPRWLETKRTHTKTFVNPNDETKEAPPIAASTTVTETTTEVVRRRENKKEIDKERRLSIKELVTSFEDKAIPFLRGRPLSGGDFTPVEEAKQS